MKFKTILGLIACSSLLFTVAASASTPTESNTVSAEMPAPQPYSGYSAQGVRVAFVKPFLTLEATVDTGFGSFTANEPVSNSNGIAVGYAYLPLNQVGGTANLTYIEMKFNGESVGMLRADANVALAATPILNFKAGVNISQFSKKEYRDQFKPALGLQASVGLQFNKNFGVDAGATMMRQKGKNNEPMVALSDLSEAGPELSLNGTF